jgi:hypothetical protein
MLASPARAVEAFYYRLTSSGARPREEETIRRTIDVAVAKGRARHETLSMITFRAVRQHESLVLTAQGWAVERTEPNGFSIVVSQLYATEYEAEVEAYRLSLESARRIMS